jgi:hypothetical protein
MRRLRPKGRFPAPASVQWPAFVQSVCLSVQRPAGVHGGRAGEPLPEAGCAGSGGSRADDDRGRAGLLAPGAPLRPTLTQCRSCTQGMGAHVNSMLWHVRPENSGLEEWGRRKSMVSGDLQSGATNPLLE